MKKKGERKPAARRAAIADLPRFCDYSCPHAAFAAPACVGACRREQGVYCTRYRAFNNKNSLCIARR